MKKMIKKFYLLSIALLITVVFAMLLQYQVSNRALEDELEHHVISKSQSMAKIVHARLNRKSEVLQTASVYLSMQHSDDEILTYLEMLLDKHPTFFSLYFGTPENQMINASGWIPPLGFDLRTRPWYLGALDHEDIYFTDVFLNASEDEYIITLSKSIYQNNGAFLGVIGGDIVLTQLLNFIADQRVSENGSSLLIDTDGHLLSDLDQNISSPQNIRDVCQDLTDAITENPSGFLETSFFDDQGYVSYETIEGTEWVVGSFVPFDDYYESRRNFLFLFIVTVILSLIIITLLINQLRKDVLSPLTVLDHHISEISLENHPDYRIPVHDNDSFLETKQVLNRVLDQSQIYFKKSMENQKSVEMFLQLLSDTEEGIFISNEVANVIYFNREFKEIFHLNDQKNEPLNLSENLPFFSSSVFQDAKVKGTIIQEVEYEHPEKGTMSLFIKINRLNYGDETYFTGAIMDLSPYKGNAKDLYYFKNFDVVTKLPNRNYLLDYLDKLLNKKLDDDRIHVLLFFNIYQFRLINEAKGLAFGNKVIFGLRDRLSYLIYEQDLLVHLGGDEFAVLLEGTSLNRITSLAAHFEEAVNQKYSIDDEELYLTVRIGASIYPLDGVTGEELFNAATSALNRAKTKQRETLQFFDKAMNRKLIDDYALNNKLREALEQGDFFLVYQPKVDILEKKIIGVEALLRLKDGDQLIPPNLFVPVAEASNLILPIGEWVLKEAASFSRKLYNLGLQLPVAVNLSGIQFKDPYILDLIDRVLNETGLPSHLLQLEITEGILMENADECQQILEKLKQRNMYISIDDFGTGYSSLAYLKKFKVDQIKIDRDFIKDIPLNDSGSIAKIIIELGRNLDLDVLAEGVETQEQEDFFRKLQCFKAQGYKYFKPLSEDELIEVLKEK